MTRDEIREQDAARKDIDRAVAKIEDGRRQLVLAVVRARDAQVPVAEIAKRADVTKPTIYAWLKDADQPET